MAFDSTPDGVEDYPLADATVEDSPPWFVHRMMNDTWHFGLLLTTGAVAVIERITSIHEYAGVVWIDVEMAPGSSDGDQCKSDVGPLLYAPTRRTTASFRADAIVGAVELADT